MVDAWLDRTAPGGRFLYSNGQNPVFASGGENVHGTRRNRLLRLAMMSSGLSKGSAIALQGVAIPLVYHALGTHQYALYLLLSAALATLSLLQLGAGPGLTQAIAKAHATGNRGEEAGALASAFAFVGGTSLLGATACLLLMRMVPAGTLFGPSFAADRAQMVQAANVAVLIALLSLVLGVVDSAWAGYQEQVVTNLSMCVSNLLSTAALIILCRSFHPSLIQVILVIFGGPLLSRIANCILLFSKRSYLLAGFGHINKSNLALVVHTGLSFWLIQATGVLEQHGGTYLMAHLTTAQDTDIFAIIYRATCLASATVGIFTQPLWPAFTDAVARRDSGWVHRTANKIRRAILLTAGALTVAMIAAGPWCIEHLWHIDVSGKQIVVIVLALYLFSNLWTHFHYIVLMGLDRIWTVACLVIVENLSMLLLGWLAIPHFGAFGMAAAYLGASIAIPAWMLPRILRKRLALTTSTAGQPTPIGATL